MPHIIATCAPEAVGAAIRELHVSGVPVALVRWLDVGVALVETPDAVALAERLATMPPVFIRHLAPADLEIRLSAQTSDIAAIASVVATELHKPDSGLLSNLNQVPFAVQVRLGSGTFAYTRYALAEPLRALLAPYAAEDVRHPQQVLAVYCTAECAYVGLWPTTRCLSDWPGGERRFARVPHQVSRSEFKLLEALEVFGLELPTHGRALDLGAAPGGWTRLLAERGLAVVAVDPAALDEQVVQLACVQHRRQPADAFLADSDDLFDLVVNDMRMDARDSARLMQRVATRLHPGSLALVTLKLPHAHSERVYEQARRLLEESYSVVGVRQLFHNRSEVTVALKRPA